MTTAGNPEGVTEWMPIEDLIDGRLYKVVGFHLLLATWSEEHKNFTGRATKHGQWILRDERHWDADQTRGTCKPLEIVEQTIPEGLSYSQTVRFLTELEQELGLRLL